MKIRIKKVDIRKETNRTVILYLQKKCLPMDAPYKPETGHWWIAYDENDKPVGFAGLVRSISWYDCGYLCRAGVLYGYTGKGLQKRLINARLRQARKLGWKWAITDTTDNPASSNSLINQGFKIYEPTRPWAYKHSLYWRKRIDAVQEPES
jgi:GNAT superfamily N-acetyltransferase